MQFFFHFDYAHAFCRLQVTQNDIGYSSESLLINYTHRAVLIVIIKQSRRLLILMNKIIFFAL